MSTTIDSLDIQISTSAGSSAQKIQELADALGNLKNQGKIGAATSAMKSLAKALDVLNPSLNAMNPAKLQQLRAAMSSLASIQKASGLNSAVNTLKKIPEVLNSLDDSTLVKLEMQMRRLSSAIAPLATEIDKIGNGFAKLPQRVTQVVNATNKMAKASANAAAATKNQNSGINATSLNLMSVIHNFNMMVQAATTVANVLQSTMAQAMEWDGIQYRFGRAFGEDAEEVYGYVRKINEELGINIQQFMQYSSLYGSLLSGFGMAQDKVTTISIGLTELSYDIWAAYNDRFKTLEDASEAVRSAITGEIEPIRNAGIALTEASLQEYLKQIGMAKVSIEKLTEAQKAEVRYAAMMNAALNQGIVGTYASEMQTAEGAVRNLSQAFKGLVQAFGSLFIPILQAAIPYLTAFVNLLTEAVAAIASFFGIAFFEIDWGNGDGEMSAGAKEIENSLSGGAAAAKKIRDYTMGFDELNIIQPPDESSGGGAGGSGVNWGDGLDLKTLWDDSVFAKASKQVDELKQKIKAWFEEWKTEIAIVAGALSVLSIASLLGSLGEAIGLGDKFLGVVGTIKKLATTGIIITLQYSLMSEFLGNFIEKGSWKDYILAMVVGAIGTGILYSMWGPAGLIIGLGVTAVASFKAVFENGGIDSAESAVTAFTGLASAIGAVALAVKMLKGTDLGAFFALLKEGYPLVGVLSATFPKLFGAFSGAATWISSAATAVGGFVAGISAPVWVTIAAVVAAIAAVALFLARNWDAVTKAVKDFFDTNIVPKLEEMKGHWDKIVEAVEPLAGVFAWLIQPIKDLIKGFKDWWEAAEPLKVLGEMFETIGGMIVGAVGGVIGGAFNALVGMIENVVQTFSGIVQIVRGVIDLVVAVFKKGDVKAAWKKIWDGVVDVVKGVWGLVTKPISDFVDGIINFFVELWDELVGHSIVPDTINAIVDWFLSLPSKIFKPVQDFAKGIVTRFKDLWSNISSWYKSNVAPKFTASYWKGVFNNVVSAASSKFGEIKGKISEVWSGVKSWFSSNVAPKLTLSYWKGKFNNIVQGIKDKWSEARSWWNSNKPTLATVQASIASIKEKLSSAWSTARTWWSGKSALSSVSVGVSSIKDKLVSAWNTAKDWFNKQSLKLNIKTPHFSVGWNYNISNTMANIADFLFDKRALPKIDVSWYAQGGMPAMGELFVANEAGPELVGKIGSRNAVVNNDQIVAAVSEGVYAAVVAAMKATAGQGGNGQAVNVFLDGKQITSVVEQRQRERGATVMGTQVFSY